MGVQAGGRPAYVLGHTDRERRRLGLQAAIFSPSPNACSATPV